MKLELILQWDLRTMIWTSLLAMAGCSQHQPGDADHQHGGEPKTAQVTVWGEHHELFIEHPFVVAANPARFVTHVTDLRTQQPRREGSIQFALTQSDETPIEQVEQAPARAGIYEVLLSFPRAGDWQVTVRVPAEQGDELIRLPPVRVFASQHDADHAPELEPPEGVSFLKEQQWRILSKAEPATKRRLINRVRLPAQVRVKPGFSGTVVAPLAGQLAAPEGQLFARPGQRVGAGQLIAILKPNFSEAAARVAEAGAEFATAKAVLEQAELAYARTKKLASEQAKSPRELQEALLGWESAKARYSAAAGLLATFQDAGGVASPGAPLIMELRAPIAGVLDSISAGPGNVVGAGQPIFTVLNTERVWIEGRIPEASVPVLSAGKDASVESGDQFTPITGEGIGEFLSMGLEIDSATRALPVIYEAGNPSGRFRIGQRVTLHVETARAEEAVAVPDSALVDEGDELVAFVQVGGETFSKRIIRPGIRDQGFVQILEGIAEGERVVTKGAYAIRLASLSGAIPAHGHVH